MTFAQLTGDAIHIGCADFNLPMPQIVGFCVRRHGPSVARSQIFQQLNGGAMRGFERSDTQTRAEYVVQAFLLYPVIFAGSGYAKPEHIPIKVQTGLSIGDDDGRMVNAKE